MTGTDRPSFSDEMTSHKDSHQMAFADDFNLLTGHPPFPWQNALFERFAAGGFPKTCDLPTGLGKTSVMAIWLLALARNPGLPRRLVYVVNRRTVVDQSTAEAERLRSRLLDPQACHVRRALDAMAAVPACEPLVISTLRGEFADNGAWRRDPSRPAIIVGTVDMIGSRLLFSGYGCGFRSRPMHAGFLGQDVLLVHDEAHLEPAFQALLDAIALEQRRSGDPRAMNVLALSATGRAQPDFTLVDEDFQDPVVQRRLRASKWLRLHAVTDRKELPERITSAALQLEGKVIVFLSTIEHAEKCAAVLGKAHKGQVATLTGTMRGAERDGLIQNPVFARFLPRPAEGLELRRGTVYLVATSAGEVGIDLSADHLVTDLPPFDALAQRLGRVNRYGDGEAEVHVYCEPLRAPTRTKADDEGTGDDDDDEQSVSGKDAYEHARACTKALLGSLPVRTDGCVDASPAALRALPRAARVEAATPRPQIHHVDALLFDRWSYTTLASALPGRPPVAEWLHGKAEWEPPRTTIAWRTEVAWLTREHLGQDSLDDFLADYPLRSRETLSDLTPRIVKHLGKLAESESGGAQRVWLVRHDRPAEILTLAALIGDYDPKRAPTLDDAIVVLPPEVGGLSVNGMLDGAAGFDAAIRYDMGSKEADRWVRESEDEPCAPAGMRLVRAVQREVDGEAAGLWWHLYAISQSADD